MSDPKPAAVYAAICDVSAALAKHGIAKDRNNAGQGYKFRGIDDVYNALAPVLAAAKLCILPRCTERTVSEGVTKSGGVLYYVVCRVEFDVVCATDGSKHTVCMFGEAMDSGDKATNKAMSAAYKYMAMQLFCIPTEGDNDADATTHEPAGKRKETAADTAARQTTHDPSWHGEQGRYFARLAELGISKENADAYSLSRRAPRPSQLTSERRNGFLNHLASDAGKTAFAAFIAPKES